MPVLLLGNKWKLLSLVWLAPVLASSFTPWHSLCSTTVGANLEMHLHLLVTVVCAPQVPHCKSSSRPAPRLLKTTTSACMVTGQASGFSMSSCPPLCDCLLTFSLEHMLLPRDILSQARLLQRVSARIYCMAPQVNIGAGCDLTPPCRLHV